MNAIINNKNAITINGKKIEIKNVDFSAICELEELGLEFLNIQRKLFASIRILMAFNANITLEEAGVEIESHIKNGGNITDLTVMVEAITDSDFFKDLIARNQKKG